MSDLRVDDYLPYRLSAVSNAVSGLVARTHQDRFGLTAPQWRVVCLLAEATAGLTRAQIAHRTVMDRASVDQAVRGLVKRGLAVDGRLRALTLSEEGARLQAELAPLAVAYEAALIAGLRPEEVRLLKRLLARLQNAAETLAGEGELARSEAG